jgi:hypothetical protein
MAKRTTTTIVGEVDGKAITKEQKTKVENALKSVVERELIPPVSGGGGIVGTHHWSVTHFSIVFEE